MIIFDEASTSDSSSCCGEIPGPNSPPRDHGPGRRRHRSGPAVAVHQARDRVAHALQPLHDAPQRGGHLRPAPSGLRRALGGALVGLGRLHPPLRRLAAERRHGRHGQRGRSLAPPHEPHALAPGGLDVDTPGVEPQRLRQPGRGSPGGAARPRGASSTTVASTFTTRNPASVDQRSRVRRSSSSESASRYASSVSGKCWPMSPRAAAPSRASMTRVGQDVGVGVPLQSQLMLDLHAAQDQPPPGAEAVAVVADPGPGAHAASGRVLTPTPAASRPAGGQALWSP